MKTEFVVVLTNFLKSGENGMEDKDGLADFYDHAHHNVHSMSSLYNDSFDKMTKFSNFTDRANNIGSDVMLYMHEFLAKILHLQMVL